ncbi:PAS domain-containing sensor histidine kinase [Chelatococcus sp. SYSU_G07232]|uniref:histidine kinase n=1 Tax=Chelatococcus albus TaxID=3047466 RepID=A0ABT7ABT5_9HYPH|nr:PAS domain-containing sensor histidine kinase [Chelatococcus sp. SYSU_G07232]MDJ1156826.1 PAS domain-containing sensor histidine kinase [Chelatococcus sp. SYSU_G07232]
MKPAGGGEMERAARDDRASRVSGLIGTAAVVLALLSALVTFLVLAGMTPILPTHEVVVWALLLNGALVLLLIAIIVWDTWSLFRARREGAAAAGLHVRIVSLFSLVAAFPAVLVAIVASVTLERGLDPWFTSSLKALIGNTTEIAHAYRDTQCRMIVRETNLMAADLNRAKVLFDADRKVFHDFMLSRAVFLGFPVAMLVKGDGSVIERIEAKPIENLSLPSQEDLKEANTTDPLCLVPRSNNVFRGVLKLISQDDVYLFVARPVDPRAVEFPAAAEAGVAYYQALEQKKLGIQIAFASMFALVALIVLLSAVWFGLSFANRLVTPIRRLIRATDQVATGNFYVQVPIRRSEGDLAHLGATFNKMTTELRQQHDGLVAASEVIDKRRRFTEAVLAGVSAGVIGMDAAGRISIVNPSAEALLRAPATSLVGCRIAEVVPELMELVEEARAGRQRLVQGQIALARDGRDRTLNVRVTSEQAAGEDKGFVVTLDDITDLVAAQRTSAWADVARRIAHEIKNPLTPIQLSAERIRRKYGKVITTDREVFDQCTDTIVRQVDDIKRMVDEFSSFARMPKPSLDTEDVVETVRQVLFMMRLGNPDLHFQDDLPAEKILARFDRRLIAQAVTNIIKNATEAVLAVSAEERGPGLVHVGVRLEPEDIVVIEVTDNGKGFPKEHRQRLLEPYMTTREGGTGLGLAIVGKILEDHGGGIELLDAPGVAAGGRGARVRLWFPRTGGGATAASAAGAHATSQRAHG